MDSEGRNDAEESMKILERFLSSGKEKTYAQATKSYEAMFDCVISLDNEWHLSATRRVLDGLRESTHAEFQRRFALSLGSWGLSGLTPRSIETLCQTIKFSADVEVRRNSAISVSKIPLSAVQDALVNIFAALNHGMCDYTTEDRGDVGSWVREASMKSFATILERIFSNEIEKPDNWDIEHIMNEVKKGLDNIMFECCGRIDRTAAVAGKTLKRFCGV